MRAFLVFMQANPLEATRMRRELLSIQNGNTAFWRHVKKAPTPLLMPLVSFNKR